MKKRIFLPNTETLDQALSFIHPSFKQLASIISKPTLQTFSKQLLQFCQQTYILRQQNRSISQSYYPKKQQVRNFKQVLNQNIRQLLALSKNNYVQCLAHQYKDYSLTLKNFNFGKTILEQSLFEELTQIIGIQFAVQVVYNYTILVKYEGNYFQVTGIPLPQTYNFKAFGQRKRKNQNQRHIHSFSHEMIDRFHILYCSHTNRNSGIFRRNIFFDKGISKSQYFQQVKFLVEKQVKTMFHKVLKPQEQIQAQKYIFNFYTSCRKVFQEQKCTNSKYNYIKMVCQFDQMLARNCRLPENYHQLKQKVNSYEIGDQSSVQEIFEEMYKAQTSYRQIFLLLKQLIKRVVPKNLLGRENFDVFIDMMKDFIAMKRYQNYKIQDIVYKMDIFKIPWLKINYNKKFKKQIIGRGRRVLASIIVLLYNKLIVPVLKYNFYVTEKHKEANKLFYYRKPLWVLISKLALKKFSEMNLQQINESQYTQIRKKGIDYPQGKLRLMPKKGTFRPIITFNRKRKVEGDFYKATLNQILSDTQLVLRNLKNLLGQQIGYCIFDNKQISKRYDVFVQKWRSKGCPKMVYFTLDIKKCYDSIDTTKLIKIIQDTPLIQPIYFLIKYLRLYRNKKPLQEIQSLPNYFNFKERAHAVSIQNNIMSIHEQSQAAINIFPGKQNLITKQQINKKLKQLCDGSIISYKKQHWLQKVGIPQGLNVSGVLCSLYFAYLEDQYVKVNEGLLMRLTDDYLYIGPQQQATRVLDNLLKCAEDNKFVFNAQKINKNFYHPAIDKITDSKQITWIGKKINIQTLQISPIYELGSDKLAYAMNVNINRKHVKSFLKNKLKSLLTNQFASYFKPKIFGLDNLCANIRLYCKISLAKFFPFLLSLNKLKLQNQTELILKIFQLTIHQFLVYACCFIIEKQRNYIYHKFLTVVLSELTQFLRQKRSYHFLHKIQLVFQYRYKKYSNIVRQYEKFKNIQNYQEKLGIQEQ